MSILGPEPGRPRRRLPGRTQIPASTSSALAIESRTGGMAIAGISDLTQPARWFLIVLMMIGANSAGTGAG